MPPEAEAPAEDLSSVDAAVAFLDGLPDDKDGAPEEAPAAAAAGGAETQSEGAASAPEEAAGAAENQAGNGEEGADGERAETPIEPPLYWKPEAKAKFAALDPELQAEILAQEGPREQSTAKAKAEAAEIRTKAETELQGIAQFAEKLQSFLPQAVQTFRNRWGDNPDWVAFATQHGGEAMAVARAQYDAERVQLQQVANATKEAQEKADQAYFSGEFEALKTVAPHLADPEKGPAQRTEITKYLVETVGLPREGVARISAKEMSVAEKAMLWDRSQAKSTLNPAPKPKPPTTQPLARGAAANGPSDPKAKAAATAKNSFAQTRSIDGAVELLNALED